MLLKIFYYFTLIFLIVNSSQAFASLACEEAFSSSKHLKPYKQEVIGIESYKQLLTRLAQDSLGVENLTSEQVRALETYHYTAKGEKGQDGTFARVGNYTLSQRERIEEFLREVFSQEQIQILIESGAVEINRFSHATDSRTNNYAFFQIKRVGISPREIFSFSKSAKLFTKKGISDRLKKREKVFIELYGAIFRVRKILEETSNGTLIEAEKVDELGRIIKTQIFLITNDINLPPIRIDPSSITKVFEKTDSGFVISILEKKNSGFTWAVNQVFFSFERATKLGLLPEGPTAKDYRELENKLRSYISRYSDQIPSSQHIPHWMSNIGVEKSDFMDTETVIYRSFIRGVYNFRLYPLESETIFLAAKSSKRKIDSSELELPLPTNEEIRLTKQGYKAGYIGKLDQVGEWSALRKRLQELRANPYTTHIEHFADQIPIHIAYIREGIENHYSVTNTFTNSKMNQLRLLEGLEKEAKEAVARQTVTYYWWLMFNHKLSRVMVGHSTTHLPYEVRIYMDPIISEFPVQIMIPVISGENLGVITFNRASIEGVYPAGLINRRSIEADGITYNAETFYSHDFLHAGFKGNRVHLGYSLGHLLFHKRLLENIERLPFELRKKAEAVYFLMTHENNKSLNISYSDWTPQEIRKAVIKGIRKDIPGLFKFSRNPIKKGWKIKDLVDNFMAVYNQTLQHQ